MIEDATPKTYCVNHPNRETMLRCNRCERPICAECAVLTETGYRCKDCVRGQQKIFDTSKWYDYPLSMAAAAVLGFAGSYFIGYIGFFTIFVAPIIGVVIAEAVRWIVRRRRSRSLFLTATLSAALASLLIPLLALLASLLTGGLGGALLGMIWQLVFTALMTSSLYYRLTGIQIGR